jgi:phage RecT family recombinase
MAKNQIMKISNLLTEKRDAIERMCQGDDQKREFFQSVGLVFADNKNLQECLQTVEGQNSITQALKMVASTGLSLNPQKQEAALVAYKGKCSYQIMKEGYVTLALRTGRVQFIGGDVVRENDTFSISKTMEGDRFDFQLATRDRGDIIGFYAGILYLDDNNRQQSRVEYMTVEQMKHHRDNYRADKWAQKSSQEKGAWSTSFEGMGRKTVMKRLLMNTKISDKITEHVNAETQNYADTYDDDLEPITATVTAAEELAEELTTDKSEQADGDRF